MENTSNKYSICHIITRLDLGGSAENTLLTAIGFAEKGHPVTLICGVSDNPPSLNEKKALDSGVSIIRIPQLVRNISPVSDLVALLKLFFVLKKTKFDILHTHTSKAGILGRIAGKIAGIRHIVHTPHGHIFYGYFSNRGTSFFVLVERICMLFTDILVTLTKLEKKDHLDRGIGTDNTVIPIFSGIDLTPFLKNDTIRESMRETLGFSENHFVIGTVARLVSIKNHGLIISAAELLKAYSSEIRFIFVGDGHLREEYEERIEKLGIKEMFIFTGWRNDIPELLSAFDIFVMCSHNEGMGRAFVEAQAAGLPVIGSDVGGIPEVIDIGRTGFIVPPDDAKALAQKIKLLYHNRLNVNEISKQCRTWVDPLFSSNQMIRSIARMYDGIL